MKKFYRIHIYKPGMCRPFFGIQIRFGKFGEWIGYSAQGYEGITFRTRAEAERALRKITKVKHEKGCLF